MCGIAGVILRREEKPQAWRFDKIRRVFTDCLLFNEARGKDASGVVIVQRDGRYSLLKAPVRASELVKTQDYENIMLEIGPDTLAVLGHARKPTKGSPENNLNNHPVQFGPIIGVHNGIIQNDNEVFEQLGLQPRTEVDTEALLAALEYPDPPGEGPLHHPHGAGGLLPLAQLYARRLHIIMGSYAFLAVDTRRPDLVIIGKYMRPLSVHNNPELEAWFFSSRYLFLRKAFGKAVLAEALQQSSLYLFHPDTGQTARAIIMTQEQSPGPPQEIMARSQAARIT